MEDASHDREQCPRILNEAGIRTFGRSERQVRTHPRPGAGGRRYEYLDGQHE